MLVDPILSSSKTKIKIMASLVPEAPIPIALEVQAMALSSRELEVIQWLESIEFEKYQQNFFAADILSLAIVLQIESVDDLQELGIKKFPAKQLMEHIEELKANGFTAPTKEKDPEKVPEEVGETKVGQGNMVSVMTKDETYKLYALAGDTADEDGLKYCFYLKQNKEGAEVQQTFEGHSDVITFLAISDDMRHFFSASKDGKVKTWNTLGVLKGEKEGSPTSKEELLAAFDNQAKDVSFLVFGFSVLVVWISFFLVCFLCVSFIFFIFCCSWFICLSVSCMVALLQLCWRAPCDQVALRFVCVVF